ncbi:hypothetical protein [Vibrio breoganii]|uniref:hypothetical protein n=1 Tax=Vibrio breoganii TaxID=553239 RepID=UPI0003187B09|nr:hypothetical protein [Vibrio breoganii]OED84652.1 hypothetical protein A1QE_12575 [Vibrio breoganii ZF-55]OED94277.1 hypothetical protein A1QG_05905 [Vibrio breoganii ZF-29]
MIEEQIDENSEKDLIDRELKITLRNGGTIGPFIVTWNYGLRDFLEEYEKFLSTGKQTIYRFKMKPNSKKPITTLLLNFSEVLAVSSVTT